MPEREKLLTEARKKIRQRALSLPTTFTRVPMDISVSAPWQIGRGTGLGDRIQVATPAYAARKIKESERPLLVLGPLILNLEFDGKSALDYAIEIAQAAVMPVVATGHVLKGLLEKDFKPDAWMPVVNIVDRLRDPEWKGVRNEGNHDLVAFFGIESTIACQGLSTLKHFAPHLITLTLCPIYYPNADMPLIAPPGISHGERLTNFINCLKREM